jgi:DNA polymerase-3 subunit beta
MLINIARDTLLAPLQATVNTASARNIIPILSSALVRTGADELAVTCADDQMQVTARARADGVGEAQFAVSARKLHEIVRSFDEGAVLALEVNGTKAMRVICGASRARLASLPASDFPLLQADASDAQELTVPQRELRGALSYVQRQMATRDVRYYLNGALLRLIDDKLVAVGCDGHRLGVASVALTSAVRPAQVIVPHKAVTDLLRVLGNTDAPVRINMQANRITFVTASVELVTGVIGGNFPDYEKAVPQFLHTFRVNRAALLTTLQRARVLLSAAFLGARWRIDPAHLHIEAANREEEADDTLPIDYGGAQLDTGFDCGFVQDALEAIESEEVECALRRDGFHLRISAPQAQDFQLIMKMKV